MSGLVPTRYGLQGAGCVASKEECLWQEGNELGCPGYFQRRTHALEVTKLTKSEEARLTLEEWLRYKNSIEVDTEINLQTGQLTVRKQSITSLPAEVYQMSDFKHLFGHKASTFGMRCNVVEKTEFRSWYRLEGHLYDVQLWKPDTRDPQNRFVPAPASVYATSRAYPTGLSSGEEWVQEVLAPMLATGQFVVSALCFYLLTIDWELCSLGIV